MVKKAVFSFLAAVAAVTILVPAGAVFWHRDFHPETVVLNDDFQLRITEVEAAIRPVAGTHKNFVWHTSDRARTPYSLVQLHGFSASRREISPVGENIARDLGLNLFQGRLCGHGLGAAGMSVVTAECLLADAEEAMAVGLRMGEKVILLGTSTGAALSLHLAQRYPDKVAAMILVSPNFRPGDWKSLLLKGPVGAFLARHVITNHSWKAQSEDEERFWTTSYPMIAAHQMMDLLSATNRLPLNEMKTPLLVFYTPADRVVSVPLILERFADYGGPKELVAVEKADHVLAGDIKSPDKTTLVMAKAEEFLRNTLGLQEPNVAAERSGEPTGR